MKKLTIKQQRFADEYIIRGNATQAAIKAGYSGNYANTNASKLLQNTTISDYIKNRLKELEDEKIMDLKEALELTTSIARREVQKGYSKTVDKISGEVTKEIEYEFTPTIEESQKSLEHLLKCLGGSKDEFDKSQQKANIELIKSKINALNSTDNREDRLDRLFDIVEGEIDG